MSVNLPDFDFFYRSKKAHFISMLGLYSLLCYVIFGNVHIKEMFTIPMVVSFGGLLFYSMFDELRNLKELHALKSKFLNELEYQENVLKQLKELSQTIHPEVSQDSLTCRIGFLRQKIKESDSDGAWSRIEVDREFDACLLIKRKSLPIDEILQLVHKEGDL